MMFDQRPKSLGILKRQAQSDLRLCWSHIQHCWKSHVAAHNIKYIINILNVIKYTKTVYERNGKIYFDLLKSK